MQMTCTMTCILPRHQHFFWPMGSEHQILPSLWGAANERIQQRERTSGVGAAVPLSNTLTLTPYVGTLARDETTMRRSQPRRTGRLSSWESHASQRAQRDLWCFSSSNPTFPSSPLDRSLKQRKSVRDFNPSERLICSWKTGSGSGGVVNGLKQRVLDRM